MARSSLAGTRSVERNADVFRAWGEALTADGDILIYGCDLAASGAGEALVDALAQLTRADVAASDDRTGHAALGGDWDLEYQFGVVETALAPSSDAQKYWSGVLADLTVDTTTDVVDGTTTSISALLSNKGADGFISLREAIIAANNTAGADQITLQAETYTLTLGGTGEDAAMTGDLDILDTLTIVGAGSGSTTIDAAGIDRVFEVHNDTINV